MAAVGPKNNQVAPADDLYTTLLIISAAVLLIGIVFVAVRSVQIFESLWPAGGG